MLIGENELADKEPANQNEKIPKEEPMNQKPISMKLTSEGEIEELASKGEIEEPASESEVEEPASEETMNKKLARRDKARQTRKP